MCTRCNRRVCDKHQATESVFHSCLSRARTKVTTRIDVLTRGITNQRVRERVQASICIWTTGELLTLVEDVGARLGVFESRRDDTLLCTQCHNDSVTKVMSALTLMERVEAFVKDAEYKLSKG